QRRAHSAVLLKEITGVVILVNYLRIGYFVFSVQKKLFVHDILGKCFNPHAVGVNAFAAAGCEDVGRIIGYTKAAVGIRNAWTDCKLLANAETQRGGCAHVELVESAR